MLSSLATHPQPAATQRLIFTRVGTVTLGIPAGWVAEILRVSRAQLLDLPFYSPLLLGVIHQNGTILPLVSGYRLLQLPESRLGETSVVVSLNTTAASFAQVGLVVDQLIGGSTSTSEVRSAWTPAAGTPPPQQSQIVLDPNWLPQDLWQPHRWGHLTPRSVEHP